MSSFTSSVHFHHSVVQAEDQTKSSFPINITFTHRRTDKDTGRRAQTQCNIHIDWQRLTEWGTTKYKKESNIMRWRQVTQMMKTMYRWLMREWVQEWREEDPGKCSSDGKTDWCRRRTVTISNIFWQIFELL